MTRRQAIRATLKHYDPEALAVYDEHAPYEGESDPLTPYDIEGGWGELILRCTCWVTHPKGISGGLPYRGRVTK